MGGQPKSPDPFKQAAAQREENNYSNQSNIIGSNANQYTPWGSVTNTPGSQIPIYDSKGRVTGYGTQWNQNTTLTPQEQAIFNQEQANRGSLQGFAGQQLGMAKDVLGKSFNTEGLPDWAMYGNGPALRKDETPTDRNAIQDAMMASYRRGAAPGQRAEDAQMAARGQSPGGKMAYNVQQGRDDALAEQTRQAYLASGDESRQAQEAYNKVAQQDWLNANQKADQQNTVRSGMFGERQQTRNQIVNEISAMMNGGQVNVPQGQGFQGSQSNPFDIAGAMDRKYQYDQQNYQNKLNGLFGIGKTALKLGMMPFTGGTSMFAPF